jgi:DNA (cytosine-5)-methyltransferase 3A
MDVVSLFDGVSCARVALDRAGIDVKSYTAYEIDKYAIQISKKNHPTIQHKGDVKEFKTAVPCDLLIGGSPCTDLSIAKKDRKGLKGDHSSLFYEYVRILNLLKPKWFVLENVASMKASDRDTITATLGVEPVMIDAGLVSAQRRKRYFWTNLKVELPADRGIVLKDILQPDVAEKYFIQKTVAEIEGDSQGRRIYDTDGKSITLAAGGGGWGAKTGLYKIGRVRRLTPIECERLQSLPDEYTAGVSDTQRYKCCGNAFNVEVVAHILRNIPGASSFGK